MQRAGLYKQLTSRNTQMLFELVRDRALQGGYCANPRFGDKSGASSEGGGPPTVVHIFPKPMPMHVPAHRHSVRCL